MKKQLAIYSLLISTQMGFAQTKNIQLSLSGGMANSSSKEKDNLVGNGFNLQADVFVPLFVKETNSNRNSFALGFTLAGNYSRVKNLLPDNREASTKYNVYNTTVTIDSKSGNLHSNSFAGFAGIQAQFGFGRFYLSPSFNSGYMNFKQEGYTQTGAISVNGQQYEKELVRKDKQQINGLILKPQLKAGFRITDRFLVFATAAIVSGPEMEHNTNFLVPKGGFKENNMYEVSQLTNGTWANTTTTSRYHFSELNIGLSIAIGKKKGTGAASASYAAGKSIQPTSTNEKSINEQGVKLTNASALAKPGNPIGGIIVKGGKNPGGDLNLVSDENGKVTFEVKEAGDYAFQLSMPEQTAGKSISEQSVKRNESAAMAAPGSPIGGIVVKGGKNPGGNSINVVSNSDGTVQLPNLEPGNYLLILHAPAKDGKTPKHSRKKVKERATPGLKDTIKTQV